MNVFRKLYNLSMVKSNCCWMNFGTDALRTLSKDILRIFRRVLNDSSTFQDSNTFSWVSFSKFLVFQFRTISLIGNYFLWSWWNRNVIEMQWSFAFSTLYKVHLMESSLLVTVEAFEQRSTYDFWCLNSHDLAQKLPIVTSMGMLSYIMDTFWRQQMLLMENKFCNSVLLADSSLMNLRHSVQCWSNWIVWVYSSIMIITITIATLIPLINNANSDDNVDTKSPQVSSVLCCYFVFFVFCFLVQGCECYGAIITLQTTLNIRHDTKESSCRITSTITGNNTMNLNIRTRRKWIKNSRGINDINCNQNNFGVIESLLRISMVIFFGVLIVLVNVISNVFINENFIDNGHGYAHPTPEATDFVNTGVEMSVNDILESILDIICDENGFGYWSK